MTPREFPTLNGVAPSWADLEGPKFIIYSGATVAKTVQTADVAAFKWEESLEVGTVRGTSGGRKMKRTSGQGDCNAGVTFYKDGWKLVRKALQEVADDNELPGYGHVVFDVLYQWTPPGETDVINLKIVGARAVKSAGSAAEGADADKSEIDLNVMRVEDDGDHMF